MSGTLTGATSMASLASGLETPPVLAIRKDQTGLETPDVSSALAKAPKQLYQVLEQKEVRFALNLFVRALQSIDECLTLVLRSVIRLES